MAQRQAIGDATAMGHLKPYPACKGSGVDWLGDIPEHWEVGRLKYAATLNPSATEVRNRGGSLEVSFVPMEAIGEYGGLELTATKPMADVYTGYTYFREGDIVVAKITPCFENGKGALAQGLNNGIAFGTTELHVLRVTKSTDPRFLFYASMGDAFRRLGEAEMYGAGGQKRVPDSFIENLRHPLPPLPEQRAIAAFLDRETAKIDALVAKKERLIELLQEKRTALVTQAVTKGLDPDVQMKDSGITWLGGIPAHWDVQRTKYSARLESGHTPSRQNAEYWQDCQFPWFTLADVWQIRDGRDYVTDTRERVSELGLTHSSARLLPKGTVILSRTASVGFSAIMGVDMATSQDYVNWVCHGDIQPEYLLYVLRSMDQEFQRLTMGSTHRTIYMPDVGQFSAPLPPIEEQREIVEFVRLETSKIDTLLSKARNAIDRLMELRTALISAAVTGKIDVRPDAGEFPEPAR